MYELFALMAAILVVVTYCILEYCVLNVDGQTTIKLVSGFVTFSELFFEVKYDFFFYNLDQPSKNAKI